MSELEDVCEDLIGRISYQKENRTLTLLCGDLTNPVPVKIENTYPSKYTFNRNGEKWYLLGTNSWADKEKTKYDASSVFINLATGEVRRTPSLDFWKARIQYSPNGMLVIVDAGITASSARQILVVDLTNWDNITVIYREEIWSYKDYEVRFDDNSNVIIEYTLEFLILDDKASLVCGGRACNYEFSEYVWKEINPNVEMKKYYSSSETEVFDLGGEKTQIIVTVTHARNPALITPDAPEKWDEEKDRWNTEDPNLPKKYKKMFDSYVFLDEMDTVKIEKTVARKRNNMKIDETNFERFISE